MTTAHSAPHRTFDCPWCGAIHLIDASHIGEHWSCPECKKATKLTASNTSDRPPTAPPPDAPHLSGDRTFDCPWCGAISSVPSAHLGERFACPECHRETKLTSTNARRAPVTAPPPDAPPSSPPTARSVLVVGGVVAVLAALGLWLAFSGSGTPKEPEDSPTAGTLVAKDDPSVRPDRAKRGRGDAPPMPTPPGDTSREPPAGPPMPTPPPGDSPSPPPPTVVPTAGTETPPAPTPPTPDPQVPDPKAEEIEKAKAEVAAAKERVEKAKAAAEQRDAALKEWTLTDATWLRAVEARDALVLTEFESKRLLAAKDVVPDPDAPTPAAVRAYNAALAAFVEKEPPRVAAAEAVLARMRADPATASEVAERAWKDVNFFGPGWRRALSDARAAKMKEIDGLLPEDLLTGIMEARAETQAAAKALAAAEARLRMAEAPPVPTVPK